MSSRTVIKNWHRGPAGLRVAEALEQLEHLQQREAQLIEQLRIALHAALQIAEESEFSPEGDFAWNCQQVGSELDSIGQCKASAINVLRHSDKCESIPLTLSTQSFLSVVQQPPAVAVANRYLLPAPIVTVVLPPRFSMDSDRTYLVRAQLTYSNSDAPLQLTLDGKQEVLQGITLVPIDKHRRAIFQKLKIMEVSSKHQHRYFSLVFRLIECQNGNQLQLPTEVRSAGFQVQSRPHKRKRGADSPPFTPIFPLNSNPSVRKTFSLDSSVQHHPRSLLETYASHAPSSSSEHASASASFYSTLPNSSMASISVLSANRSSAALSDDEDDNEFSDGSSDNASDSFSETSTSAPSPSMASAPVTIDVTNVLSLELEAAAERLRVSPKTLERRYREATRHQWPANKLHKIENYLSRDQGSIDDEKAKILLAKRKRLIQNGIVRFHPSDFFSGISSMHSSLPSSSSPGMQGPGALHSHRIVSTISPGSSVSSRGPPPGVMIPPGYGNPSWLPSFARVGSHSITLPSLAGPISVSSAPMAPRGPYPGSLISQSNASSALIQDAPPTPSAT